MRANDRGEEFKQRSLYEKYKVIFVLIGAIGGGSVTGIGVKFYNTNEVNQTPARVEILEERVRSYTESHAREEALNDLLLNQKLTEIKDDLQDLKSENDNVNRKLDELTRLVRKNGSSP
jgi:hypothetical protein